MKNAKMISLLLSCAMAAGMLAGCSTGSASSEAASSEPAAASEAAAEPTAAPAEEATAESAGMSVSALPDHYNDSSVTGTDWDAWVAQWESVATDYTKVSLTPGADGLRQVLFAKRVPVKQEVKPPVAVWLEQTVR